MRRPNCSVRPYWLPRALALLLAGCAAAAMAAGAATPPQSVPPAPTSAAADVPPLRPIQVSPHCHYVQGEAGEASAANRGFMSNAGFCITPAGVVVFDALGTPPLGRALLDAIRKLTTKPVKRVVVSHFHADHVYGLQAFKAAGAEIWAHRDGRLYLAGDGAQERLRQRREVLFPWVDEHTRLVPADRWLARDESFKLGGLRFELLHPGPAHSPEDLMMRVSPDGVLFSGDLFFTGRIPFVGDADSRRWLSVIDRLLAIKPKIMVPGHGQVSTDPQQDLQLTRDYLLYLREQMGRAVADFVPFEDAYRATDWSRFKHYPAFDAANRANAYNTYLLLEKESLRQ